VTPTVFGLVPLALLGAVLGLDVVSFPQAMRSRPIVAATLAGALAGHADRGLLAGVVKDALLSSYEMACEGTPLKGSQLVVEEIPGVIYCSACDARRPVGSSEWFSCSECGAIASEPRYGLAVMASQPSMSNSAAA
jgi:hypothetical protein